MPEFDLLTLLGGAGVLVSGVWGGFVYINGRFEKKADKDMVVSQFTEVKTELHYQRDRLDELKTLLIERLPRG